MRNEDQWRLLRLNPMRLFGAEGDDDGDDPDPQAGDEGELNPDPAKTYDQAYVDKLRKEAAKHRVEANEKSEKLAKATTELDKIRKAEMDDLEAAQTTLAEKEAALEEAQSAAVAANSALQSERILNAVTLAAVEANFQDPSDALSMISQDDIVGDDGNVSVKIVKARLKALGEKKPYLLKRSGGSGDGGGKHVAPDDGSFESRKNKHLEQMKASGRVPA